MRTTNLTVAAIALLSVAACTQDNGQSQKAADAPAPVVGADGAPLEHAVTAPRWAADTAWLGLRADNQRAEIAAENVFHDFSFTDKQPQSGITFRHQVVDDAAIAYKAVHYDHGTGVAAADVDSDGVADLYFVNQVGANELWRGKGDGTFENITASAGVSLSDRISVGAAFADIDNDGDQDLFVTSVRGGNALLENDGTGRFKDISAAAGVDYVGHSSGVAFVDINNDGLLDLFVSNVGQYTTDEIGPDNYYVGLEDAFTGHTKPERTEKSLVYLNEGGNKFRNAAEELGFDDGRWSGDIAPIDVDNDGWMDLYVLNMQGLDGIYRNDEGKALVDVSADLIPRSSWGAMGIQVFDYNNDGLQDIFVTDMHSDMADQVIAVKSEEKRKAAVTHEPGFHLDNGNGIWGNTFFRNNGDGSFSEVSDEINAENFWPWGLSAGDFNADGFQDVFIASSMNYPWRYGINSLLLNDAGQKFVDAEFALGIEPRRARPEGREFTPWFELDCAGDDKGHRDCPNSINAGRIVVNGALGTRSSVLLDLEGDGDLDIVTSEFGSEPLVLVSNLSEKKKVNSITVGLTGTQSNRNAYGAVVTVRAGNDTYTRVMDGKSGYLGQSALPLYFGIGANTAVDEIEVRWPLGGVQKLAGPIPSGRKVRVVEGS